MESKVIDPSQVSKGFKADRHIRRLRSVVIPTARFHPYKKPSSPPIQAEAIPEASIIHSIPNCKIKVDEKSSITSSDKPVDMKRFLGMPTKPKKRRYNNQDQPKYEDRNKTFAHVYVDLSNNCDLDNFERKIIRHFKPDCDVDVEFSDMKKVARISFKRREGKSPIKIGKYVLIDGHKYYLGKIFGKAEERRLTSTPVLDYEVIAQDINEAATFEDQWNIIEKKVLLSKHDLNRRADLIEWLNSQLCFGDIKGKFHVYGSTANGIGFKNADIDMFLLQPLIVGADGTMPNQISLDLLEDLKLLLTKIFRWPVGRVIEAKVPIVSVKIFNHFKMDISVKNMIGPKNSALIKHFTEIEPLFGKLAAIIKLWAKLRGLINHATSSYSIVLLVMFFCQFYDLLPSVKEIQANSKSSELICDEETGETFRVDFNSSNFKRTSSKYELIELLVQFFTQYSMISPHQGVMSPYVGYGDTIPLVEEFKKDFPNFEVGIVNLQDIFELDKNVAIRWSPDTFNAIKHVRNRLNRLASDTSGADIMRCIFEVSRPRSSSDQSLSSL